MPKDHTCIQGQYCEGHFYMKSELLSSTVNQTSRTLTIACPMHTQSCLHIILTHIYGSDCTVCILSIGGIYDMFHTFIQRLGAMLHFYKHA